MSGGSGGTPPGDFTCSERVLGAPEALFHTCTQSIYTCKLPSSISGFRSKNTTYGALASGLCSASSISGFRLKNTTYGALASGLRSVSSINAKQKSRLTSVKNTVKPEARLECD